MIDPKDSRRAPVTHQWLTTTALGAQVDAYIQYLSERGYAPTTIEAYVGCVAHFAHWLDTWQSELMEVEQASIERFLDRHLPHCCCASRCRRAPHEMRAALSHLLDSFGAGRRRRIHGATIAATIMEEVNAFDRHLAEVRGLAPATRAARQRHLRAFLLYQFGTKSIRINAVRPADVADFVEHYTASWTAASVKQACASLRSYFLFRATGGDHTVALIAALPEVAQWRLSALPQTLSEEEVSRLLGAFDRQSATGKRDYAIARFLIDLGLRRMEVARLRLEDIDWRVGVLRVHAKGPRVDVLPLPDTTGRAIADYLQNGRPQTNRRELFVRHRPPVNAAADPDIVRNAVRNAAQRCGLGVRIRGTHVLRHTLAGRLVNDGARLKDIADVLRHRSLDTTTIYAKVDFQALTRVALPWPGSPS